MKREYLFSYLIALLMFGFLSCSDEDDSTTDEGSDETTTCLEYLNQEAQGEFQGESFTAQGGTYSEFFGEYRCKIYVNELIGGDCSFPEFGGNEAVIIFSLEALELQSITFTDTAEIGETVNTLNFNSIVLEDNVSVTVVELATCGALEITDVDLENNTVSGTIVAKGQEGSFINGNFTLDFCEFGF